MEWVFKPDEALDKCPHKILAKTIGKRSVIF